MGQYFLTVNLDKRQYLNPHKFGAGLKLMEFSGQSDSLPQALCILLAHSNGRGGGDLRSDDCDPDKLVGSWAGDRIVVAGDYDDDWLYVPEDLKGKTYTWEEHKWDVPAPGGGHYKNPKPVINTEVFGKRKGENCGETLYNAAHAFFEDISDRIIKVVAASDAPHHPWAAMDLADDGWRDCPEAGVLPVNEPKNPAAGGAVYAKYKASAVTPEKNMVDQVTYFAHRHPERAAALFKEMRKAMREPKVNV